MTLIITPAEIAAATNTSCVDQDVQTAQDVVELFAGRALSDATVTAEFSAADLRRLKLAVQWQVVYLAEHPEVLTQARVKRASANGASIEQDGDQLLAPLAQRCLSGLSWSAGAGGIGVATLRPSLPRYRRQPNLWTRVG